MEILTNILTEGQFRRELDDVVLFLTERGLTTAGLVFGFVTECPDLDDVGVEHPVAVTQIRFHVEERERSRGFKLGSYDCWVDASELDALFHFCNDRDVHLTSDSPEVLDSTRLRWRSRGFNVYPDDLASDAQQAVAADRLRPSLTGNAFG